MKTNKRFFYTTLVLLVAYVLSACGGLPQQADSSAGEQAAIKVRAVEVAYTGVVEAINGNEWTVNGQVLTVDPAVVQDGPFQAGDTIKIEGSVNPDGTITVSGVGAPLASDLTDLPQLDDPSVDGTVVNDNANDNTSVNDNANVNDNSNDDDSNANGNSNDNDDDDDDSNINGNSNDHDDDDDDSNSNGNGNDHDDDDDDHGSSGNSNGSRDGGKSNDRHDDDDDHGGSNSNGSDDDDDDD